MVDEIKATGAHFNAGPVGRMSPPIRGVKSDAGQSTEVTDTVEFSELGTWLGRYSELPQVRTELVDKIRNQIKTGTYETPAKWDQALDNLIEDLTT
jgi:hypothetical protein